MPIDPSAPRAGQRAPTAAGGGAASLLRRRLEHQHYQPGDHHDASSSVCPPPARRCRAHPGESAGGSIGLGFAIPIDLSSSIADQIISTGRVTHAFFGLETVPVQAGEATGTGAAEGLYVVSVIPGGPAAQSGLAGGEVITSIDGEPARSNIQLEKLTVTKRAGDVVSVDYKRAGQSLHANITLGAQP
jgi:S1-C subfamily serine protease